MTYSYCLHLGGSGWLAVLPVEFHGTVTTEGLPGNMRTMLKEPAPCLQRS